MLGLGLTITGGMSRGRAPAWTPARLFSNGQQGVWYEPKPEYLFQDDAGTTPVTADGDPVGYMQDLSGNGNHATQATSAARPIYRTDGTLHWLEFDGVDDYLESQTIDLSHTGKISWAFARQLASYNDSQNFFFSTTGTTDVGSFGEYQRSDYDGRPTWSWRGESTTSISVGQHTEDGVFDNFVLSAKIDLTQAGRSNELTARVNGYPAALNYGGAEDGGTAPFGAHTLRIANNGDFTKFPDMLFRGLIVTDNIDADIEPAEPYLANLAGITL